MMLDSIGCTECLTESSKLAVIERLPSDEHELEIVQVTRCPERTVKDSKVLIPCPSAHIEQKWPLGGDRSMRFVDERSGDPPGHRQYFRLRARVNLPDVRGCGT